jgi:hypothetical protein
MFILTKDFVVLAVIMSKNNTLGSKIFIQAPLFFFRIYDSGIFVMQFIRWYNDMEAKAFSKVRY